MILLDFDIFILLFFWLFLIFSENLRKKESAGLLYLHDIKLSVAVLVICIVFALSELPAKFDLLPAYDSFKSMGYLKSIVYTFTALTLTVLYQEQKTLLHIKNKVPQLSDTFSPQLFIMASMGAVIAFSSRCLIGLFLGAEILSFITFLLFYQAKNLPSQQTFADTNSALIKPAPADFSMLKITWLTSTLLSAVAVIILVAKEGFCYSSPTIAPAQSLSTYLATSFLICSFFIKIAAVPFHFWLNKVFYTAKNSACCLFTCITLPVSVYVAAYLFGFVLKGFATGIAPIFAVIAFLNILLPALSLNTNSIKQFIFSVSSINIGLCLFLFAGLHFQNPETVLTLFLFFLLPQSLSFIGIFAVLNVIADKFKESSDFIQGISKTFPALSFALLVFILCLIGVPPFITFLSRISLISALQGAGYTISSLGIILSMILMFIYALGVIRTLYQDVKTEDMDFSSSKPDIVILLCLTLLILLSIFGEVLFNFCIETATGIS